MTTNGKTLTTTLGACIDAAEALGRLSGLMLDQKPAYHVAKLCNLVEAELKIFNKQRDALVKQHGTSREATPAEFMRTREKTLYEVKPDSQNLPTLMKAVDDLRAVEITLPWGPLDGAALVGQKIMAADVRALGPFVRWPEEEA